MYLKLNRASFRVLPLGNGLASHIARHLLRVVVTSRAPMAGGAVPVCQCSAQQEQALRKAIDKTTLRKKRRKKMFCSGPCRPALLPRQHPAQNRRSGATILFFNRQLLSSRKREVKRVFNSPSEEGGVAVTGVELTSQRAIPF